MEEWEECGEEWEEWEGEEEEEEDEIVLQIERESEKMCAKMSCEDCVPEICGEDECERICEDEMEMQEDELELWEEEEE